MRTPADYLSLNRQSWNQRTAVHLNSAFYDVEGFLGGKCMLNDIELELLGDISGKEILHLQCHFGLDTLSLARRGATVTGVDLSDVAITQAQHLAEKAQLPATFICCDVYSLPEVLDRKYDVVFTSYGTIGWLPDLSKWAAVVSHFLKPGGRFVMADFHPVVWMMDDDFTEVSYGYFNSGPIVETKEGTYTDRAAPITTTDVGWNHSLADILGGLIGKGIAIERFEEYDYSPYNCFHKTKEVAPGRYQIAHLKGKLPMVYAIEGRHKT